MTTNAVKPPLLAVQSPLEQESAIGTSASPSAHRALALLVLNKGILAVANVSRAVARLLWRAFRGLCRLVKTNGALLAKLPLNILRAVKQLCSAVLNSTLTHALRRVLFSLVYVNFRLDRHDVGSAVKRTAVHANASTKIWLLLGLLRVNLQLGAGLGLPTLMRPQLALAQEEILSPLAPAVTGAVSATAIPAVAASTSQFPGSCCTDDTDHEEVHVICPSVVREHIITFLTRQAAETGCSLTVHHQHGTQVSCISISQSQLAPATPTSSIYEVQSTARFSASLPSAAAGNSLAAAAAVGAENGFLASPAAVQQQQAWGCSSSRASGLLAGEGAGQLYADAAADGRRHLDDEEAGSHSGSVVSAHLGDVPQYLEGGGEQRCGTPPAQASSSPELPSDPMDPPRSSVDSGSGAPCHLDSRTTQAGNGYRDISDAVRRGGNGHQPPAPGFSMTPVAKAFQSSSVLSTTNSPFHTPAASSRGTSYVSAIDTSASTCGPPSEHSPSWHDNGHATAFAALHSPPFGDLAKRTCSSNLAKRAAAAVQQQQLQPQCLSPASAPIMQRPHPQADVQQPHRQQQQLQLPPSFSLPAPVEAKRAAQLYNGMFTSPFLLNSTARSPRGSFTPSPSPSPSAASAPFRTTAFSPGLKGLIEE